MKAVRKRKAGWKTQKNTFIQSAPLLANKTHEQNPRSPHQQINMSYLDGADVDLAIQPLEEIVPGRFRPLLLSCSLLWLLRLLLLRNRSLLHWRFQHFLCNLHHGLCSLVSKSSKSFSWAQTYRAGNFSLEKVTYHRIEIVATGFRALKNPQVDLSFAPLLIDPELRKVLGHA